MKFFKSLKLNKKVKNFFNDSNIANLTVMINENNKKNERIFLGFENKENNIKLSDKSIINWGSISKLITTYIVLDQINKNKIDLNKDIREYFDFKIPKQITKIYPKIKKTENIPILMSEYKKMRLTVKHLLTHTSGLNPIIEKIQGDFEKYKPNPNNKLLNENKILQTIDFTEKNISLMDYPGRSIMYTNYNHYLLAKLLIYVLNQNFEEIVSNYANELDLKTIQVDRGEKITNKCVGYNQNKPVHDFDLSMLSSAQGFMSTSEEMIKFIHHFYTLLQTNPLFTDKENNHLDSNYGYFNLGYQVFDINSDKYAIGHTGSTIKCKGLLKYYPKQKITLLIHSSDESLKIIDLHSIIEEILFE